MAEEKKKSDKAAKAYASFYYIFMTLAVMGFGYFGYLKLTDTDIYFYSRVINCYTLCFTAAFIFLALRIFIVFHKNGNKVSYQVWLLIISCMISCICLINSVAEDFSRSRITDTIEINEDTEVLLCETGDESTRIDIYRVKGGFVKKIGEIDETYFSVKCIEQDLYTCDVSEDGSLITINCNYGVYGNGIYMIAPAYDTGTLSYTFQIN